MSNVWGTYLRDFRERTGLTQGEFSDAMSLLWLQLSDADKERLSEIGVEHLDLGSSDLSRYENGHRLPRNRSRYAALIYALYKLESIQSIDEADEWLHKADQGPLTIQEKSAIFDSLLIDRSEFSQTNSTKDEATPPLPTTGFPDPRNLQQPDNARAKQAQAETLLTMDRERSSSIETQANSKSTNKVDQRGTVDTQSNELKSPEATGRSIKTTLWALIIAATLLVTAVGVFVVLYEPVPPVDPDNLIVNGDFSNGMRGWVKHEASEEGELDVFVEDEALCANIIESGRGLIYVHLAYNGLEKLSAQTEYVLSFNVDVDSSRALGIEIPGSAYIGRELFGGPQSIEATFFQDNNNNDATIIFKVGRDGPGLVCFDNIVLRQKETVTLPTTPVVTPDPNNLILNGNFDVGTANWWYWVSPGNELSVNAKNGELCSEVLSSPEQHYDMQLGHHVSAHDRNGPSQNTNYLLSFDVTKATTGGKIKFGAGDYIDMYKEVDLEPGPQKVEQVELGLKEEQAHPSLSIHLGQQAEGSIVCLDNIVLTLVNSSAVESPKPTIAASAAVSTTDSASSARADLSTTSNLVSNGGFAKDLAGWWLWAGNGGEAELSVNKGELCSEIQAGGEHPAAVNVGLNNVDLSQIVTHTVLFDVTSDTDRTMRVVIDEANEEQALRAGQQQIQIEFTPTEVNPTAQLAFWLGAQHAGTVCFDNVVIVANE